MDPITIIVFLLLFIMWAPMFFGPAAISIQKAAQRKAMEAKLRELRPEPSYDTRWDDPKYVEMIHNTMALEENEFGETETVCEATCHKPMEKVPSPKPKELRSRLINKKPFVVENYEFQVPFYVPDNARSRLDHGFNSEMMFAKITWFDTDGKQIVYMACHWNPPRVGPRNDSGMKIKKYTSSLGPL